MKHYCTLGYYGSPSVGIHPAWDGELFTEGAAQGWVNCIEQVQQAHPSWRVATPFGMCIPRQAYLQAGRIVWELEDDPEALPRPEMQEQDED